MFLFISKKRSIVNILFLKIGIIPMFRCGNGTKKKSIVSIFIL